MNISMVEMRHRVHLQGKYNVGVYVCRNCQNNMLSTELSNCIGFAGVNNYTVIIIECTKCFKKFYYHASDDTYRQFLDWVGFGWSRFFTKKGNKRRKILEKSPRELERIGKAIK